MSKKRQRQMKSNIEVRDERGSSCDSCGTFVVRGFCQERQLWSVRFGWSTSAVRLCAECLLMLIEKLNGSQKSDKPL